MNKRNLTLFASLAVLIATSALAKATITVATFADPSNNSNSPLFHVSASSVSGGWIGNNLNLIVAANQSASSYNTFANSHMAFDNGTLNGAVSRTGNSLGAGRISFYTGANLASTILTVTFSGGSIYEPYATGASFVQANNVSFSGSAVAGLGQLSNDQFTFSFANPNSDNNVNTYTASYTSSATAVPEPASLLALGFAGILGLVRRRKA